MPMPLESPCVWIAGGGTGGHLYPGLALAAAIRENDPTARILFVGTKNGLDSELVPRQGFSLVCLPTGRGSPLSIRNPLNFFRFLNAFRECERFFRKTPPSVVVSLGGFAASVPGLLAAWHKTPLLLLEQNVLPGRVTRLLSRWASEIHMQFGEAKGRLSCRGGLFESGSPARREIAAMAGCTQPGERLIIMGGSQGARRLNELVRDAMPQLVQAGIPVTHITGERDHPLVAPAYRAFDPEQVRLLCYVDDMASELAHSKLAFVRAGASTINDLELAGVPSVLVPYPFARDNHQAANALVLEREGAALVWEESGLTADSVAREIIALWNNPPRLSAMRAALMRRAHPQAAQTIAAAVLALARR